MYSCAINQTDRPEWGDRFGLTSDVLSVNWEAVAGLLNQCPPEETEMGRVHVHLYSLYAFGGKD